MEPRDHGLTRIPPAFLVVGRVGRAHGVHGEVRVEVLTDVPERRFAAGSRLYIGRRGEPSPRPATVVSSRPHHDFVLARFDVASTREDAARLAGQYLYVPTSEAAELPPDSFYEHEIVGMSVVLDDGTDVGRVTSLWETGSAEVLQVRAANGREHLIPFIGDVIAAIDVAAGRIIITPLPGLLDEGGETAAPSAPGAPAS